MSFITPDTWQKEWCRSNNFNKEKWLNEKHIEEQLGRSTFNKTTLKYPLEFRKQRQELQDYCIKQS